MSAAVRWDVVSNALTPLVLDSYVALKDLPGPEAAAVLRALEALAQAVQGRALGLLAKMASLTAPRRRTAGEERRRRGRILAEVRGTIRRLGWEGGWCATRDVVAKLVRTKRATEGEVVEALRVLEEAGEVERRVVAHKGSNAPVGQVRLSRP